MNRPKEVLSKKEMERLMYDVYLAEAMMENDYATFNTPEKKEAFIDEVFRKHKVTEARWDTSLSWYSDHIEIYIKMNDSVKARLQRSQKAVDELVAQKYSREQELNRQNMSPSYIPQLYTLGMRDDGMGFSFRLDTAEINKRIDQNDFDFRFDVLGISPRNTPKIKSMLVLEYQDTIMYKTTPVYANQQYAISGQRYIANDTLQQIVGFIHLENRETGNEPGIQVYNITLGKMHQPQPQSLPERQPRPRLRDGQPVRPEVTGSQI